MAKTDFALPFKISKSEDEKRRVFGWLSVSQAEDGSLVEDLHKSVIDPDTLEEAAYLYVLEHREGGDMHVTTSGVAKCIESMCFTAEKQAALGIPDGVLPKCAWWIGLQFDFTSDGDSAWAAVKSGDRPMLSIGGTAEIEYLDDGDIQ